VLKLTVTKKRLVSSKLVTRKGKKVRVRVIRTQVRFSSKVTENGIAASAATTTTAAGKRVGGSAGSFILTARSATLRATAVLHHDASVPTGQTAAPTDLFYADLGAAACTKTAAFGGLPCADATVGSLAPSASVVVRKYLR
jgi:hypothetical protein